MNGCGPNFSGEYEDYKVILLGDTTSPQISLKYGSPINIDICNTALQDTGAVATDIVDGNLASEIKIDKPILLRKSGQNTVTYFVSDSSGNRSSVSQTVRVTRDTVNPDLTLKDETNLRVQIGSDFIEPGYIANDKCGNVDTVMIAGNVNTDEYGAYYLAYMAVDGANNTTTVTRKVSVVDTFRPEPRLIGADTIRLNVFGNYSEQGVSPRGPYYDVMIDGKVNLQEVGTYHLTYKVADPANSITTLNRVVIVEDNEAPIAKNVQDGVVTHPVNEPFEMPFTIKDNYYHRDQVKVTARSGSFFELFANGTPDSVGFYNARYTLEDPSGNVNSITTGIQVVDRIAPTIQLLGDKTVIIQRWEDFPDAMGKTFSVSDNSYADARLDVSISGSYFSDYIDEGKPSGLFEKQYVVTDPSGNSAKKTRGVLVRSSSTGVAEAGDKLDFTLYPSPSDGQFKVVGSFEGSKQLSVHILNPQGKVVEQLAKQCSGEVELDFDLTSSSAGLYQVKIQTGDEVIMKSIMIQ